MSETHPQIEHPEGALDRKHSVPVALLILALPIIASMVSRTVMSFVDFIMVSQLGTAAQAAIMPAGILLFCVISFGMGMMSVVSAFVSQNFGRGRMNECAAYLWQGLWVSLALGVAFVPAWWAVGPLFRWVGHEPLVQQMEIDYVQIGLLGLFPMLGGVVLSNFFNGVHKPAITFWAAVIANVYNVAANYALIFGHWGFEPMGMAGAAWATTTAQVFQLLILMAWAGRPAMARVYHTWAMWRPSWYRIRRILWYGFPAGAQFAVDIVAFSIFTILLVGRFGTVQLAAHNLAFKFLEVSFMPSVGLGIAVTAAVGKAIGEGDKPLARSIVRWATGFAMIYMGTIAIGYLTLRHELAGLLSDQPEVVAWAAKLLLLCAVFQVFDALGIIHINALRGAGDNHWPAVAAAVLAATILIGGGYLLAWLFPQWGAVGPWAAATLYIMVLGSTMCFRWRVGPWESINLLDHDDPTPERGEA